MFVQHWHRTVRAYRTFPTQRESRQTPGKTHALRLTVMEAAHPMNTNLSVNSLVHRRSFGLMLASVIGVAGAFGSGMVQAQATAGMIFGKAPAGDSVTAVSAATGIQREVHVGSDGHYALRALPAGVYVVTLQENGNAVVKHPKVPVTVGRGVKVDFDCSQGCANASTKE